METRICKHCEQELPLTLEYFSWANTLKNRFLTVCRDCKTEYNKQYRSKKYGEPIKTGDKEVYTIKEEPLAVKHKRIAKAFKYIHLEAFGEEMSEDIYWCRKCDVVQITNQECGECSKSMEKIGFIDYSENDK